MKKNNNITTIDKLTRNTDKQLMQILLSDLNQFRHGKSANMQRSQRNKQAA